ncbi:hypothetical protein LSUE1_G005159 [Lachnellula suecica]|uniref:Oxidoreductase n=1 Tax=Lachnellula suecica TaxID=602035 RepID=A0A8T9CBE9_9HELO|nr:hypothetical protein LSUE1_G005159 [Lachnellula suecica]
MSQTLVIIGSGPGIGVSVASLFAVRKFDTIALLSRNTTRLSNDRETVLKAAQKAGRTVDVKTFAVDITSFEYIRTLAKVEQLGNISCVVFNPARVAPGSLFELNEQQLLQDFQTTNIGCYETARWALPLLRQVTTAKPTFIVTSSIFAVDPIPQFFGLFMVKAGQRNLVQSIQKVHGADVHIALVNVNGLVSVEDPHLNPDVIAERFWGLYEQEKGDWAGEINVPEGSGATFKESAFDF